MATIQMKDIEKDLAPKKKVPAFRIGDTVDVHVKITEGDKERIQVFSGVVIARKHGGISETFTVRRIVQGEGVERIFPVYSPRIANIVVKKRGEVRRAKLYYLREKSGKSARVKELLGVVPGAETLVVEEEPPKTETPKENPKENK